MVYRFRQLLDLANAARNRKKQKDFMKLEQEYEEDKSKKNIPEEQSTSEALDGTKNNGCTHPSFDVNSLIDGLSENTSLEEALTKMEHLLQEVPDFDGFNTPGDKPGIKAPFLKSIVFFFSMSSDTTPFTDRNGETCL